jgi:hypothetical protein
MMEDETDDACGMREGREEWIQGLSRQITWREETTRKA